MAEKITQRKEYRGLGYAPTISVPGLIQTRPVAATRPPQTNELTKLAKSLSDFGETFGNSQLRKAAAADEEAKELAKQDFVFWDNAYPGRGWRKGKNPFGSTQREGPTSAPSPATVPAANLAFGKMGKDDKGPVTAVTHDRREQILTAGMKELVDAGVIRQEATPAYFAYLKREAARSIVATQYSKNLEARIDEAAIFEDGPEGVDVEARARDFLQLEDNQLAERYGEYSIWAPEEVAAAEEKFLIAVRDKHNDNRKEYLEEKVKSNIREALESDDPDQLLKSLERTAYEGFPQGVDIRRLAGEAAISAVTFHIARGHPEVAQMIAGRIQEAKLGSGQGERDLIPPKVQDELERLVENAERDQQRFEAADVQKAKAYVARRYAEEVGRLGRNLTRDEEQAFARKLSNEVLSTGRKVQGEDGSPVVLKKKIGEIDGANGTFTAKAIAAYGAQILSQSPQVRRIAEHNSTYLERLTSSGQEADLKKAREFLETTGVRETLGPDRATLYDSKIKKGQQLNQIQRHPSFGEAEARVTVASLDVMGLEANASPADRLPAIDLANKIKKAASLAIRDEFSVWLNENKNASDDQRAIELERIIPAAFKKATEDLTVPQKGAEVMTNLRAADRRRRAALKNPNWFRHKRSADNLERRRHQQRADLELFMRNPVFSKMTPTEHLLDRAKNNPALLGDLQEKIRAAEILLRDAQSTQGRLMEEILDGGDDIGPWDAEELKTKYVELRKTLLVTGLTPKEIVAGQVESVVMGRRRAPLQLKTVAQAATVFDPNAAKEQPLIELLNPNEIPMFKGQWQLQALMNEEGQTTINQMLEKLGVKFDPNNPKDRSKKAFLTSQLDLLRSIGR